MTKFSRLKDLSWTNVTLKYDFLKAIGKENARIVQAYRCDLSWTNPYTQEVCRLLRTYEYWNGYKWQYYITRGGKLVSVSRAYNVAITNLSKVLVTP